MSSKTTTFLKSHYLFFLYSLVFLGLLIGLFDYSGAELSIKLVLFFYLPFTLTYFVFKKLAGGFQSKLTKVNYKVLQSEWISAILVLLSLMPLFLTYSYLGYLPGINAIFELDYYKLFELRKSASADLPRWLNYFNSFVFKSFVPFSFLYFAIFKKNFLFYLTLIISFILGITFMQKSFFMFFYLPILIWLFLKLKFVKSFFLLVLIVLPIFFLVVITNPAIKLNYFENIVTGIKKSSDKKDIVEEVFVHKGENYEYEELKKKLHESLNIDSNDLSENNNHTALISNSIIDRVIFLPGRMIGLWFEAIPSKLPHTYGDGYRFIARIKGNPFVEYDKKLYPIVYKNFYDRGFEGTVNCASFMYDYANFGFIGLILSGIMLGGFFVFLNILLINKFHLLVAVNTMPILMLSSVKFSTLLLSGGWVLLFLLCVFLLPKQKTTNEY